MARKTKLALALLCAAALATSASHAGRLGGGKSRGSTHVESHPDAPRPHADAPQHADVPHVDGSPALIVRPNIHGSSSEEDAEEELALQQAASRSSGGSGIHTGYLMLGLAGPMLFILFRLRKFFRLRRDKTDREAEFAQNMLLQHGRTPAPQATIPAAPVAHPGNTPAPASVQMADGSSVDAFMRQARASFLHLRTLNQAMNGEEVRNYLSPALVEKLRPSLPKNAEAVKFPILKAELLESHESGGSHHATLRFFGTVRPSASGPVFEFAETWRFSKANAIENWQVDAIARDDNPGLN